MLKELTELVTLAEQTLPNHQALLGLRSNYNPDVIKLFHAIQTNKFRTEAEAIEKSNVGARTKFRQVAKDLLCCLEQMVYQIGIEKSVLDDFNQSRIRGFQLMALAKSFSPLACRHAGKKNAEELLKIGLQYARPEFVVEAAKMLMDYVSVVGDDLKEFDQYHTLYQEYSEWRNLEEKAQIYHDKIKIPFIKKKGLQKEYLTLAHQYIQELEPYVGVVNSHSFHLCFYILKSYSYTGNTAYRASSQVHQEAINFFETRPYACDGTLNIFYYLEIANCFYLAQYSRGRFFYQKAIERVIPGNTNWFNTLELGFYLCMHEQDYLSAAEIYSKASKNKRFGVLRDTQRETWLILGAYLYIMYKMTGAEIPESMIPKIKSSKFRNEVKDFSQDKTGMNIAILAAEVLINFVEGKEDELWDRIASLEKYRERYLRNNEETHRAQLFIKILTILSKFNYDPEKFLEKSAPLIQALKSAPLQHSKQAYELEIVPYEKLVLAIAKHISQKHPNKSEPNPWRAAPFKPGASLNLARAI